MASPGSAQLEAVDGGRLRLPGSRAWRERLRGALAERRLAWTARRLEGWGELFLAATRDGLCRIGLGGFAELEAELGEGSEGSSRLRSMTRDDALLAPFTDAIAGFLAAPDAVRLDLPVDAAGTAFQRAVWRELVAIPSGELRSYKEVAVAIGRPGASRAVGGACGANPVPFVVPCHRVVGSDGRLTGFGLGLPAKRRLLAAESGAPPLPL